MDYLGLDLQMPSLSPSLLQRLRTTLLQCDDFNSDSALRGAFLDPRISLWRAGLPEEASTGARVSSVINYLSGRFNKYGENGLFLLAQVLRDLQHPDDSRYSTLEGLALELEKLQIAAQLAARQKAAARQAREAAALAAEHPDQLQAALVAAQDWVDLAPDDGAARALLADLTAQEEARRRMQEEAARRAQEEEARRRKQEEARRRAPEEEQRRRKQEEARRQAQKEEARLKKQEAERLKPAFVNVASLPVWLWGVIAVVGLLGLWGLSTLFNAPLVKPVVTVASTATFTLAPTATPSPTSTPTPTPKLGDTWMRRVDDMVMVYVPAGEFQMGSEDSDAYSDEKPVHTVKLDAFWIDRTEVTNAQYAKCVQAGQCVASTYQNDATYNGATQPVVGIDWHNAAAYCAWAGGQLPTEAQWEYAARGREGLKYPWGNQALTCELANYGGCVGKTAPVGSYSDGASWVGALDMAGNVWEWTADWFGTYPSGQQTNPTGPSSGEYRVVRGGSWAQPRARPTGDVPLRGRADVYGRHPGVSV